MIRDQRAGALWRVAIDRPEKANSLTKAVLVQLREIAREATDGPRALILTGAGGVFSAGQTSTRPAPGSPLIRCGKNFRRRSPVLPA